MSSRPAAVREGSKNPCTRRAKKPSSMHKTITTENIENNEPFIPTRRAEGGI